MKVMQRLVCDLLLRKEVTHAHTSNHSERFIKNHLWRMHLQIAWMETPAQHLAYTSAHARARLFQNLSEKNVNHCVFQ